MRFVDFFAGNGVTVNVARAIGERLKEIEENETL